MKTRENDTWEPTWEYLQKEYKKTDIIEENDRFVKVKCNCPCHSSNGAIIHLKVCCEDGIKKIPKKLGKDK